MGKKDTMSKEYMSKGKYLEEDIEVIRPIYEKVKKQMENKEEQVKGIVCFTAITISQK